jgi:hypothetical protein
MQRARREDELGSPTRRRRRASIDRQISADHALGNLRGSSPSIGPLPPLTRNRLSPPPLPPSNALGEHDEVRSFTWIEDIHVLILRSVSGSVAAFRSFLSIRASPCASCRTLSYTNSPERFESHPFTTPSRDWITFGKSFPIPARTSTHILSRSFPRAIFLCRT